ncbi:unnamed protein product [Mytilus edulis]|uniref:MAM domain-containing protein n=1 Tax=Mytilus edulis TaxID=6550 RepID=A0A8S3UA30_MYTED|nr:unnamed protein product [Mytilus edulis]
MQKFIVLLLLLDLFSVTLQKSDRKEVTIPVSSPIQLECDDDLKVNNIEVTIRRSNTTCLGNIPKCILPTDSFETIKKTCNEQVSCDVDIRNITEKHRCLQEYGYFNISYSCKMINDLSCDFESNLCNWLPVHDRYGFQWRRGSRGYLSPTVDHTTAYYWSVEGDTAKLESGHIIATKQQCFSFWYFTTNSRDSVYFKQKSSQSDVELSSDTVTKDVPGPVLEPELVLEPEQMFKPEISIKK